MRDFRLHRALACLVSLAIAFVQPAQAQTNPRVEEFLALVNAGIVELAGQPEQQARAICHRIVSSAINMEAIVRGASAGLHDSLSPQQHTAYRLGALRWAVQDCVHRNRDNGGGPLELVGTRQGASGELVLATRSNQLAHTTTIWRLRGLKKLQAVDVVIDGRSMSLALRDETNALLDRNAHDIDRAIDALGR